MQPRIKNLKLPNIGGLLILPILVLLIGACGSNDAAATPIGSTSPTSEAGSATSPAPQPTKSPESRLKGNVAIAGSSTVFPISEAMAEEFSRLHSGVRVNVASTGTGAGFRAMCAGDIQVSDASAAVTQDQLDTCAESRIELIEIPVAFDALSVVVNPENTWVSCLSVEELATIFGPDAQGNITKWNQVNGNYPDTRIRLYGPTTSSGTFEYFTEAIVGEKGAHRGDLDLATEDDPLIAQGVNGSRGGIGYFGLAYLAQYGALVASIPIRNPDTGECVQPSAETVESGAYRPLARPIFIYVNAGMLDERPELEAFVEFYLENAPELVPEVGYVALPREAYDWGLERLRNRTTGSVFKDVVPGTPISEALDRLE